MGRRPRLTCSVDGGTTGTRVVLDGELDLSTVPILQRALDRADLTRPVLLDLGKLRFLDSSGLQAVLTAARQAGEAGAPVTVQDPQPVVARLLTITGAGDRMRAVQDSTGTEHDATVQALRGLVAQDAPPHAIARLLSDAIGDGCVVSAVRDHAVLPLAFAHRDHVAEDVFAATMPSRIPQSESSVFDVVVGRGQPLFLDTPPNPLAAATEAYRERVGVGALACAPVLRAGSVVGLVGASRDAPGRPYDAGERRVVCAAAILLRSWAPMMTDGLDTAPPRSRTASTATSSSV